MMEGLELACFEIISYTGCARSHFVEAIQAAKQGDFHRAEKEMEEGESVYTLGHKAHAKLIQQEAGGEATPVNLLLLHAADLMMSAETFKVVAREFIDLYQKLKEKGCQV